MTDELRNMAPAQTTPSHTLKEDVEKEPGRRTASLRESIEESEEQNLDSGLAFRESEEGLQYPFSVQKSG